MPKNIEDSQKYADKCLDFLVTEYGFEKIASYYVSYEYHFGYRRDKIEINISCEADGTSLPRVTLRDYRSTRLIGNTCFPEYYHLTEIEVTDTMKEIFRSAGDRSYRQPGTNAIESLLQEYAGIIKRHPGMLSGDLSAFPQKKTKDNDTYTIEAISIRQADGTMKTTWFKKEKKITHSGYPGLLKYLFKRKRKNRRTGDRPD